MVYSLCNSVSRHFSNKNGKPHFLSYSFLAYCLLSVANIR